MNVVNRQNTPKRILESGELFKSNLNKWLDECFKKWDEGDKSVFKETYTVLIVSPTQSGKTRIKTHFSSVYEDFLLDNKEEFNKRGIPLGMRRDSTFVGTLVMGDTSTDLINQHLQWDSDFMNYEWEREGMIYSIKDSFDFSRGNDSVLHNSKREKVIDGFVNRIKQGISQNKGILTITDEVHRGNGEGGVISTFKKRIDNLMCNTPKVEIDVTATFDMLSGFKLSQLPYNNLIYVEPGEGYVSHKDLVDSGVFKDIYSTNCELRDYQSGKEFVYNQGFGERMKNLIENDIRKLCVFRLGNKNSERPVHLIDSLKEYFGNTDINIEDYIETKPYKGGRYDELLSYIGKDCFKPIEKPRIVFICNGISQGIRIHKPNVSVWYELVETKNGDLWLNDGTSELVYQSGSTHIQRSGRPTGYYDLDNPDIDLQVWGSVDCIINYSKNIEMIRRYSQGDTSEEVLNHEIHFFGTNVSPTSKRKSQKDNQKQIFRIFTFDTLEESNKKLSKLLKRKTNKTGLTRKWKHRDLGGELLRNNLNSWRCSDKDKITLPKEMGGFECEVHLVHITQHNDLKRHYDTKWSEFENLSYFTRIYSKDEMGEMTFDITQKNIDIQNKYCVILTTPRKYFNPIGEMNKIGSVSNNTHQSVKHKLKNKK